MAELEFPDGADRAERRALLAEFADVGDVVEVADAVVLEGERNRLTGEIVAFEDDLLVLEAEDDATERLAYGDLDSVARVERDDG